MSLAMASERAKGSTTPFPSRPEAEHLQERNPKRGKTRVFLFPDPEPY